MASKFNKLLLVKKTTKFERMKSSGKSFTPYIENVLMKVWEEAANVHISVADFALE